MTSTLSIAAAIATDPAILREIREPDCNLAIWTRSTLRNADGLLDGAPKDVRFNASLADVKWRLEAEMRKSGFSDAAAMAELIEDAHGLAQLYCDVMDLSNVEVRLEVVTTDSCRKWHADYVKARLITTYTGTGTQWLDTRNAELVKNGEEPAQINTMNAGDVGLFKGKLASEWPAVHRSPPIAGTGEKRLLLVLNPPEA